MTYKMCFHDDVTRRRVYLKDRFTNLEGAFTRAKSHWERSCALLGVDDYKFVSSLALERDYNEVLDGWVIAPQIGRADAYYLVKVRG